MNDLLIQFSLIFGTLCIFFILNIFLLIPIIYKLEKQYESHDYEADFSDFIGSPLITLSLIVIFFFIISHKFKGFFTILKININVPFRFFSNISNKLWSK